MSDEDTPPHSETAVDLKVHHMVIKVSLWFSGGGEERDLDS